MNDIVVCFGQPLPTLIIMEVPGVIIGIICRES